MIYSADDFRKLLDDYFYEEGNLVSIEEAVLAQNKMYTDALLSFMQASGERHLGTVTFYSKI